MTIQGWVRVASWVMSWVGGVALVVCAGTRCTPGADKGASQDPVRQEPGQQDPVRQETGPTSNATLALAVHEMLLGEVAWDGTYAPNAWHAYSVDLDGLASTVDSEDHCATSGHLHRQDGPDGEDNDFAKRFHRTLHNFGESAALSAQTNDAIAQGKHTLLIKLTRLDGAGPQQGVRGRILLGGSRSTPPRFDGQDVWPVRGDDGREIDDAGVELLGDVQTDGTFVSSNQPDIRLELSLRGYRLPLTLHRATVRLELSSSSTGPTGPTGPTGNDLVRGTLAGVLHVQETADAVERLGREMFRVCHEGALVSMLGTTELLGDIMADLSNGDRSKPCDAISVGIGLRVGRAELGQVVADPTLPDPCADGVDSSGPPAGSCESVPPYEFAVSCTGLKRPHNQLADRAAATACPQERPVGPVCPVKWVGESDYSPSHVGCFCHDECDQGRNGRCDPAGHGCSYDDCIADSDCPDDHLCACSQGPDETHRCIQAGCRTNADCAGDLHCSPTRASECSNVSGVVAYQCHTENDGCQSDADCDGATTTGLCVHDAEQARWVCSTSRCTVP